MKGSVPKREVVFQIQKELLKTEDYYRKLKVISQFKKALFEMDGSMVIWMKILKNGYTVLNKL